MADVKAEQMVDRTDGTKAAAKAGWMVLLKAVKRADNLVEHWADLMVGQMAVLWVAERV